MKKSSFHFITGDRPLGFWEKRIYKISAAIEYLSEQNCDLKAKIDYYKPVLDEDMLAATFGERLLGASPSRVLCFDYLLKACGDIFGPSRHILDIGCGFGDYSRFLANAHGYASYRGVDIEERERWSNYRNAHTSFDVATLGVDEISVDGVDTVFSQSVLEHVEYDRSIFDRFTASANKTVEHIHLIPATRSYFEHRLHGFRRYGPCTINRLLSSPTISDIKVTGLGNWVVREMHWKQAKKTKKNKAYGDRSHVPLYDNNKSIVANLKDCRKMITASDVSDAGFFVLRFKQEIPVSKSLTQGVAT